MAPAKESKGSTVVKKEPASAATSAAAKKAAHIAKLEATATKACKAVEAAQVAADAAVAELREQLKIGEFQDALGSLDFASLEKQCSTIILPSGRSSIGLVYNIGDVAY
jgi:hypothetical protein